MIARYLQKLRYRISANEQVDFLVQIARGMAHLHSFDAPIIHGKNARHATILIHIAVAIFR